MLADFHLLRPLWLLALLPVALLWWLLRTHRQDLSPWQQLIASHLQPVVLISQQLQRKQPWAMPLLASCWLLTVVALTGPSWQKLPQPALTIKKATVLIMDMSLSMRATDMTPDRLSQQRFKALDFVEQLREGDLALISYAADAFVISPLTPDHNNIRLQIPTLRPELMPEQGSNVLAALQLASTLLQQAGYPSGDVVLFTDGFDHDSYHAIQQWLNSWPYRLSILAFGQSDGAVVRLENGELLKNAQGGVVIPKVPLQQLQILARQGGGVFQQATADNSDLQAIIGPRNERNSQREPETIFAGDQWQDNAVYLVWLLLPLALWLARRAPILLLLPAIYLPKADAMSWQSLWQNKEQQAIEHYQQQQYQDAQQKFTDPLWRGNAAYRAGDYRQATESFWQAIKQHPSAPAWHNLGNALAMQQQYQQALDAYLEALALNPDDEASTANAELMRQLLQQQQAEQQQDNNGEAQDKEAAQPQNAEQQQTAEQNADAEQKAQASGEQNQQDPNSEPQNEELAQQLSANESATEEDAEQTPDQNIIEQSWPNATPEQQQELENLLRKVQDDPGILLRNRMLLEHQKRRTQPPSGARQEW
ncbi:membrane protein [Alishewanella longhuensis]|uniref:Membrane protein n=1 Tax=Alishewanella longhuensis TaxID=1091037 RepID=A0ABQ3KZ78_9ALTE|nr:VWA domain-containing protein [Alishewanella longhuensis]GHG68356.1 membrane protein [Alishewanella longhuensis]